VALKIHQFAQAKTMHAAIFPSRRKCGVTLRGRARLLNRQKSGPPEQGIPGRAYQIDAGWMGGRSIDRSRKPGNQ
jgi:hypothetical protein